MKLTKEAEIKRGLGDAKLRELGITEYLIEPSEEQINKAIETLDFEEFEIQHPKDASVTMEMIGAFYQGEWLGARVIAHRNGEIIKESIIQSKEHYEKTKKQFQG
ncbi:MAG: hypothetical protein ACLFUH_01810 [Bacteroidales bacterium]